MFSPKESQNQWAQKERANSKAKRVDVRKVKEKKKRYGVALLVTEGRKISMPLAKLNFTSASTLLFICIPLSTSSPPTLFIFFSWWQIYYFVSFAFRSSRHVLISVFFLSFLFFLSSLGERTFKNKTVV